MFNEWLKTDKQASWDKVIKSLEQIGLGNAANEIKEKFQGKQKN